MSDCEHAQGTRWESYGDGPDSYLVTCVNCFRPIDLIESGNWWEEPLEQRPDWPALCAVSGYTP